MPRGVYERKPRPKVEKPIVYCRVDGCCAVARRPAMQLCEKHYYRQRRFGSFEKPWRRREFYIDRGGYVRIFAPQHPAASAGGVALQHRVFFYDKHGGGPFDCHWCSKVVGWAEMHVDHVNADPTDNRLENLVASCGPCNMTRGFHKSKAANQARGLNLTFGGETLPASVWAERLGIARESLKARLAKGWPLERALTEPRGKFGPRSAK